MSSVSSAVQSGVAALPTCAPGDSACRVSRFTALGFNTAAASYFVANTGAAAVLTSVAPALDSAIPTSALAALSTIKDDSPEFLSFVLNQVSVLPGSQQQVVSSYLAQGLSIQRAAPATTAASSGATGAANSTSSGSGGSGAATGGKPSSGAAAHGAQPTEVALMAMAGIVAGVAGVVVGL